jgi:fructose-1-phosphate kinase PfkB-like protein
MVVSGDKQASTIVNVEEFMQVMNAAVQLARTFGSRHQYVGGLRCNNKM